MQQNAFGMFTIKTCLEDGWSVGHLPREFSRIFKFLLERSAFITAEIMLTNYRRLTLVKGGLEIPCKINVKMFSIVKNVELLNKFKELFANLYIEPESHNRQLHQACRNFPNQVNEVNKNDKLNKPINKNNKDFAIVIE